MGVLSVSLERKDMDGTGNQHLKILNIRNLNVAPMPHLLAFCRERRQRSEGAFLIPMNPIKVIQARRRPDFQEIIDGAHWVFPDAYGLKWAARLLHRREIELTPGYRLMFALLEQAESLGQSVYLLGTTDDILELGRARMLEKHPRLRICGWHNGFFKPEEEAALFQQIARLEPDFVFVAMGEYLQEKVIARLRQVYSGAVCQGVGGSIDLLAGRQPKPPEWMVRHHLEWLFRMCRQPFRLPRFKALPIFAALVIKERLRRVFSRRGNGPSC